MPSEAALKSVAGFAKAELFSEPVRSGPRADVQTYYHAAFALSVATWDAYLNDITREFYSVVANPLNPQFHAMAAVGLQFAEGALKQFNTPNFDNSRELLVNCTGYDPYSDWAWPRHSMTVMQVKERLNQILKVRHSFAHGFAVPAYEWTQSKTGRVRLTNRTVADTTALLRHLIRLTDRGLGLHIATTYGIPVSW